MTNAPPRRRKTGGATINDVADYAGVSRMTVSRVVNGDPGVREETRARVASAVRELGYMPNPAARSLAGAHLIRLGLIYSNPSSAYLSEFLLGALQRSSAEDVQLMVEKCSGDRSHKAAALDRMIASEVHGVILSPPLCDSEFAIRKLKAAGVPLVAVATIAPHGGVPTVGVDDRLAALTLTRRLVALGHRRIGFVMGDPVLAASGLRLEGYRAALREAGITPDDSLVMPGDFTYQAGLEAGRALLSLTPRPTAVFASNDDMAAAVVAVAHRMGLDVPGDLTVCGYDDTVSAVTLSPALTTVRQPVSDMSGEAVSLLVRLIRDRRAGKPGRVEPVLMDFALVERESHGPAPDVIPAPRAAGAGAPKGQSAGSLSSGFRPRSPKNRV